MGRDLIRILVSIGVFLLVAGVWWLAGGGQALPGEDNLPPEGVLRGQTAPDFTLTTRAGEEVRLSDLRGRPVFLNFWATWCPPCRWEMPYILDIHEQQADVHVFAINVAESPARVDEYLTAEALEGIPVLMDSDGTVYELMRITGMPTSLFLDARGVICERRMGTMTGEMMAEALGRARSGC